MATDAERLQRYEDDFRRAGLPLFSEDISPYEDIFNRAAPLLGIVLLGELLGAGQLDWTWWQNVLAVAGGLLILLVAVAIGNRARGRPWWAVPERLGKTELAGFVLVPAVLPVIFGGQVGSALVTAGGNLLLLGLIYAVVGLGLVSIIRWVIARIVTQLRSALTLLARAVPLLAIFVLLSFPTQELWEMFTNPTQGVLRDDHRPVRPARCGVPGRTPAAGGGAARARGEHRRPAAAPAPALQRRPRDVRQPGRAGAAGEPDDRRLPDGLRRAGDRRLHANPVDRRPGERPLPLSPLRRAARADQRAAARRASASPRSPASISRSRSSPTRPTGRSSSTS